VKKPTGHARIRQGLMRQQVQGHAGARAGAGAGSSLSMADMSAAPAQVMPGPQFGGSVPNVRRDHVIRSVFRSGLASAMAPDIPRSMLVTMIVCLMVYSLHFTRHLVGCRGLTGRPGSGRWRDVWKLAKMRQRPSIGGTWPSRAAEIGTVT
jgi:hypothetical protein